MAFNFRPKNTNEILKKKKKSSESAASVYEFVNKNYGETIVLDPTKDFNVIKIPRTVEKKDNIATIKRKMAAQFDIKNLNISFGNGSGAGGSNMNAADTAMQENATRFVCEQFIDGRGMPTGDLIAKIYPKYDDAWHTTFEMQASSLKKWLGSNRGYEYSRDKGIMPYLEGIAINKCGVSTKDSWNPADIYLVKIQQKARIMTELKTIGDFKLSPKQKLDMLNNYMRRLFIKRELIGISLKKLGKSASLEETNVTTLNTINDISIMRGSIKLNLDLARNDEFNTGELAFKINVGGKEVNVQVRAFSGGVRESTQMDMTGQGAAAKLGKVSSKEAIDPFLSTVGLKRRMGSQIPAVGKFSESNIKSYVLEQKKLSSLTIGGSTIDFGSDDWEDTMRRVVELEKENNRVASQLSAKLQCFQWLTILKTIDQRGKLEDFLSILYYGAKKQYETAGPFLKIS